jgi:hypothetical protein
MSQEGSIGNERVQEAEVKKDTEGALQATEEAQQKADAAEKLKSVEARSTVSTSLAATEGEKMALNEHIAAMAASGDEAVRDLVFGLGLGEARRLEQILQDGASKHHCDDTAAIEVVAPSGAPTSAPRPVKFLKPSCVDISEADNNQDCLNLSGAPRKIVPLLRQRQNPRNGPQKSSKAKKTPADGGASEEMQWELVLSTRAAQETALIEVLHTREFTLDEFGRVEIDDHVQAGALARRRAELPGELTFEDGFNLSPSKLASQFSNLDPNRPRSPQSARKKRSVETDDDVGVSYDVFYDWRQRQIRLNYIKQQLQEQSLLGHISANFKNLVKAPTTLDGTHIAEPLPPGSEPPPSPVLNRRRRNVTDEMDSTPSGVDDRYLHACSELKIYSKPTVLKALRAVECGGSSLPPEFSHGSYLGDRGIQALCQALVGDDSHDVVSELRDLRTLDLHGQGIGNEAAGALAHFLSRCPRLRVMNLSKNQISETGLQKLMEEVKVHPSLDILNIDMNPVPSWQRLRLKQLLEYRRDGPVPGMKMHFFEGAAFH